MEKIRAEAVSMIPVGQKARGGRAAAGADAAFQKLLKERDTSSDPGKDAAVSGNKSQNKPSGAGKAERKSDKADEKEKAAKAGSPEDERTVPAQMLLQLQEMAGQTAAVPPMEENLSQTGAVTVMEAIPEIQEAMPAVGTLPGAEALAGELTEVVPVLNEGQTELPEPVAESVPESLTEMAQAESGEALTAQKTGTEPEIPVNVTETLEPEEAKEESRSTKAIAEAVKAARSEEAPKEAKEESRSTKAIKVATKAAREDVVQKQQEERASEKPVPLKQMIENGRSGAQRAGSAEAATQQLSAAEAQDQQQAISGSVQTVSGWNQTSFDSTQENSVLVKTSEPSLAEDVGRTIVQKLPQENGKLTIELEPASLGKLTIRVLYQAGKATVSILADNPRTQALLSMKATELASILEERTGQETLVYTDRQDQELMYDGRQSEGEKQREENRGQKEEQTGQKDQDSFLQQLRLGFIS